MNVFYISRVSDFLHSALKEDGQNVSPTEITNLIKDAAEENYYKVLDDEDYIPAQIMYLIYADITDKLGITLGHEIAEEGFALDWAEDKYPELIKSCLELTEMIVQQISSENLQAKIEQSPHYQIGTNTIH